MKRINAPCGALGAFLIVAFLLTAVAAAVVAARYMPLDGVRTASMWSRSGVMLILRGVASADEPRGQLDDKSALEYARRLGYRGEVLNVAGDAGGPQVKMALDRIRRDSSVKAIYGFSGGGYNARSIWKQLSADERKRVGRVIVVGSPGLHKEDFPGSAEVVIKGDPPAGHMAGPKALLGTVGRR